MPFPRNWLEELCAEYACLRGYSVETDLPYPIGKKGGRQEFDVLGSKLDDKGNCSILHIEAGRAGSLAQRIEKVKKQLLDRHIDEELEKRFKTRKRDRWFVVEDIIKDGKVHKDLKNFCGENHVKLVVFEDLLDLVKSAMDEWKENHKTKKGSDPTLPESLWLMKLLDRIWSTKNESSTEQVSK